MIYKYCREYLKYITDEIDHAEAQMLQAHNVMRNEIEKKQENELQNVKYEALRKMIEARQREQQLQIELENQRHEQQLRNAEDIYAIQLEANSRLCRQEIQLERERMRSIQHPAIEQNNSGSSFFRKVFGAATTAVGVVTLNPAVAAGGALMLTAD